MKQFIALAGLAACVSTAPLAAQGTPSFFVEARVGAMVPTFDIADDVKTGTAFGGSLGYQLSPRLSLLAEFDYGKHDDKATGLVDITTMHYMAKIGYAVMAPTERGLGISLNLGAGAVTFDSEGATSSFTYPAINAGAKLTYGFSRSVALVVSPQGDIAFGKEDEIGTSNAWVWPVTAGLRLNF